MNGEILARASKLESQLREDRRWLHAHAETGFCLTETSEYVAGRLKEMGLMARKCGRCGWIVDIGSGEDTVLLRADMDALPIREQTLLPFACGNGCMHACGHDLHTAMLLGAAQLLRDMERKLTHRVRLMFQPAEENLLGAGSMLQHGLLDGCQVRAAYMLHVMTNIALPVGTAIVSAPGVSAPAAAFFEMDVQGRGCHGAMPHTGVDPLMAAAQIVLALEQIRTRELAMNDACVLTLGMLRAGDSANVIPDKAAMAGTMRAMEDETLAFMLRRTEEIAAGTASSHRARAVFRVTARTPTLLNGEEESARALTVLREALGEKKALLSSELSGEGSKSTGSEDFAAVSHLVPSAMIALAAGRPQDGHNHPAHHPCATFDEAALAFGAAAYTALGVSGI